MSWESLDFIIGMAWPRFKDNRIRNACRAAAPSACRLG
jgi:hypothetical protein